MGPGVTRTPYWLLAGSKPVRRAAVGRIPDHADLVVVGGGIAGLAAAVWGARLGARTVLLEGGDYAAGATARNIGLMLFGGELDRPGVFADLCSGEEIAAHPRPAVHLSLLETPALVDVVVQEAARSETVELLDRQQCATLLGTAIAPRFRAGRRADNALVVDPVRLAVGLAAAAVRAGALMFTGRRVRGLTASRDGVRVDYADGVVHGGAVVIAAGLGTSELIPALSTIIRPHTAQIWRAETEPGRFGPVMAVNFGDVYWRQLRDGTVLIGGLAGGRAVENFFRYAFPQLPPVRALDGWTGTMACTPDGRPILGPLPGSPNVWLLTGFGGHGLPPTAYASKLVVRAALGVEPMAAEAARRHAPERFARPRCR
jgi:glycine/D-amino acid oxidase-like deaminating enzyme